MNARPFVIHHVGARHGNFPFPAPPALRGDLAAVLYDADIDCVAGVANLLGEGHIVLPYCLAEADGEAEFKITANASGSSLLEPSEDVRGFRQSLWGVDWDLAEGSRVEERRMLRTRALDGVIAEGAAPAPDFLSLDTQGSELAILKGASDSLNNVVGVVSEVQFIDLYEKVPRFGDVSAYLEAKGFRFVGFTDLIRAEAAAAPIGCRTQGFVVAGDALFLRRLEAFEHRSAPERSDRLERLAFAALVFGNVEYALAALKVRGAAAEPVLGEAGWRRFVQEVEAAASIQAEIFLPLFPEVLKSGAMSAFRSEADPANWPDYFDMAEWAVQAGGAERAQSALETLFGTQDSALESLLRDRGFPQVADDMNFRRRDQSWKLGQLLKQAGLWRGEPGS